MELTQTPSPSIRPSPNLDPPVATYNLLPSAEKAIEEIETQGKEIRKCVDVLKDMVLKFVTGNDEWTAIEDDLNRMKEEEWKMEEQMIKEIKAEMKKVRNMRRASE